MESAGGGARRDQSHALGFFLPFQVAYLDAEPLLPVLVRKAA